MTSNNELSELIKAARIAGATVLITYDDNSMIFEGREIIDTVQVIGIKGCGPFPMPAIAACERLRQVMN